VWVTTADESGHELSAVAVDFETGEVLHDRLVFEVDDPEPKNKLNSYASPSPVIEAGRVWVHFGTYGTACLDTRTGDTLWERRDIHCDHMEGPGSSPLLFDDLLIFHMDGGDVQFAIALDKATGETRWQQPRSAEVEHLAPDLRKAYSTPIVVDVDGAPRLISSGAQATVACDPRTGKELWTVRTGGFSMSARPLFDGETLFLNTGYMTAELIAVRAAGEGDVTATNIAWRYRRGVPKMASSVLVDGRLYMVSDDGIATCLEAGSGEPLWRQRIGGQHCASPVFAAGRIYFFGRGGHTVVVEAGDAYRQLADNELDAGFMASPAIAGDAFVLRTTTHLYRIEEGGG
jgi:outer membrane protein assembly factor BamB